MMRRRLSPLLALLVAACRSRDNHPLAEAVVTADVPPQVAANAPPPTNPPPVQHPPVSVQGPWSPTEARGAAFTPALWVEGGVRSALAIPADDARSAEMRWVRWSAQGTEVVARHVVRWIAPGATMSLVPRVGGATIVWSTPAEDASPAGWRAIDVTAAAFAGDERAATETEVAASEWSLAAMGRRSRENVNEPAPALTLGGVTLRVEPRRQVPVALLGDVEVARGDDLMGFERSVGLDPDDAAGRWAALSRGACQDARLELYQVSRDRSEWKGAVTVGREVGVRWISVDAGPSSVVVSWSQDLIPLRVQCTRGADAPTVADQGLRVALFPR